MKRPWVRRRGLLAGVILAGQVLVAGQGFAQSSSQLIQQYMQSQGTQGVGTDGPLQNLSPLDRSGGRDITGGAAVPGSLDRNGNNAQYPVRPDPLSAVEEDYRDRLMRVFSPGSSGASQIYGTENQQFGISNEDVTSSAGAARQPGGSNPALPGSTGMNQGFGIDARLPGNPLRQFGYDSLKNRSITSQLPAGAVGDDYRLGIGDEIVATFRGGRTDTLRTRIDRDGRVVLPGLAPIGAAGRPFGEVRAQLLDMVHSAFLQTDAYISLGTVRSLSVYVVGQVQAPGLQQLNGLSNVIDAIVAAGGVTRSGTLRNIQLVRGNSTIPLDLYSVLQGSGARGDLSLSDGERIVVGALGPTIAIAGKVARPAIYELGKGGRQISVAGALALAGEPLRPEGNTLVRISQEADGRSQAIPVTDAARTILRAGDILLALQTASTVVRGFMLDGDVASPGLRSLQTNTTIRGVIANTDQLGENPYMLFAALETTDPVTRARHYVGVDLTAIATGTKDVRLQSDDRLIILRADDVAFLGSADVQAVISGNVPLWAAARGEAAAARVQAKANMIAPAGTPNAATPLLNPAYSDFANNPAYAQFANDPTYAGQFSKAQSAPTTAVSVNPAPDPEAYVPACAGLRELQSIRTSTRTDRFSNAVLYPSDAPTVPGLVNHVACPPIFERMPHLLSFLLDNGVVAAGDVGKPGIYPVVDGTSLSKVVAVAGGLMPGADLGAISVEHFGASLNAQGVAPAAQNIDAHVTPLDRVALAPGDVVRFNQRYSDRENGPVRVLGEVRRPGTYVVSRGETLSQLLDQAGGLTPYAYPLGAVFTRATVREQERQANIRNADQFEQSLSLAAAQAASTSQGQIGGQIGLLEQLVQSLRNTPTVGRVVAEADPAVLVARPQQDILLQGGDQIIIPKRPNTITVSGEVLNPGTQEFNPDLQPSDYIRSAGGFTRSADDGRAFVVLPNGTAQPLSMSSWNFTTIHIPPGSTIVVPRDPTPYQWWNLAQSLITTTSSLALTAASLAVVSHQN